MEPPTSWNDPSLLNHEPLRTYCSLYSVSESRRGAETKIVVENFLEEIRGNHQVLAVVQAWLQLAFLPESEGAETPCLSAHDTNMQTVFFEYYCRLHAGDGPEEYLLRTRKFGITRDTRVSGRGGHGTKARGRGKVGRGRDSDRGHSRDKERSNPKRPTVAKTSQGYPRRDQLRESSGSPISKRTRQSSDVIPSQVTNDLSNPLQLPIQDDHSGAALSDQGRSNPKRLKVTPRPRGRPRKIQPSASDEAPAAGRLCTSSGDIPLELAEDLPSFLQPLSQDDHLDPALSLDANHPELASSSQSHVHDATHGGRSEQLLAKDDLSRKRDREDSDIQFNDSDHFPVSSPESAVASALPQAARSVLPLPRSVSTKHISSREAQQIADSPMHVLDQEDVGCLLEDVGTNTSLTHFQPISGILENWAQTHDNDQDDVVDVDEIANDASLANDVPLQVSSHEGVVEGSAPTIQPETKLPLPVRPQIWAQTRQEVCESFDYFRSYQGGVYSSKNIVKGYLLGGSPASRDIFHDNGRLIISHGGGKSESILDYRVGPARFQQAQNQEVTDKSVRALLKSYMDKRPLVLLVDDKYALFPFDLSASGYTYIVLGFYWISHAWAEYQPAPNGGRVVRWKFAFRWCGQDDPWWAMSKEQGILLDEARDRQSPNDGSSAPNTTIACKVCSEKTPVVYSQGWLCLNPSCSSFWSLGGREPDQLDYDTAFLRPVAAEFRGLPDLRPGKLVQTIDSITTSYAFSKGWHCEKCGRLSSRFKWEHWECSNCHSIHKVPGRLRLAKEFWHQLPTTEFLHSRIGKLSGITASLLQPFKLGDGGGFTNYLTFTLPDRRGKIYLVLGTPLANKQADEVFQQYQEQAEKGELLLRRYPLRSTRVRGAFLTNYFSQNSGEPYQYVGATGCTVPFDEAPSSVCGALALIKERSRLALQRDIPFNEILSAAYMERQKMSFHSDSERGLGPVVASLSLGSAAFMHFRPHTGPKEAKPQSSIALTLILRHGDVLIMEGDGVQRYYEHTVIPMNFRIAATARCIGTA